MTKPRSYFASNCFSIATLHNVVGNGGLIDSGDFRSVVVHQDLVYAADSSKNQTQVFQYNATSSPRWTHIRSIDHDFEKKGATLTLSISNNQLKCCSYAIGSIKVYSLSGDLLLTHTASNTDQFYRPIISDDDDDGSVLIADCYNDRLQVMSEQGEFSVLQLQPPVSKPRSAVLFNNHLYVMTSPLHTDQGFICKYAC